MEDCKTLLALSFFLWMNRLYSLANAQDNGTGVRSVSTNRTAPGPLCYSCDMLTDPKTCGHRIRCGRDELCMLHELNLGIDGSKRYTARCEAETICESLRNHAKRAYVFCHNCCKQDLCNNHCGSTPTLPTTTSTRSTQTTTPKPTTKVTTTKLTTRVTTPKPTTTTQHVNYPIMCFSCNTMLDPSTCKHLVTCTVGHACMLQVTGRSISGQNLYKSSCEPDLLCSAIDRSVTMVGKRDVVDGHQNVTVGGAGQRLQKRYSSCTKCCRQHLCNNHCDSTSQHVSMTTTTQHTTSQHVPMATTTQHIDRISATPLHTTSQSVATKVVSTTAKSSHLNTHANRFSQSYLGCFLGGYNRLLSDRHWTTARMTVQSCISFCKSLRFAYAGLERGTECFCGNLDNGHPPPVHDNNCGSRCGGNSNYICGGHTSISIYMTQTLCYKCDVMTQPDDCTNVTVCSANEVCVVYQTEDHLVSSGKLYHAGCSSQQVCDVFSSLPNFHGSTASKDFCHTCCTSPLCNTFCTFNHPPTTLAPTKITQTTRNPNGDKCKQHDFVYIPYISLCFKLETLMLSYSVAEHWCKQYGATLAILDNSAKFSVVQSLLKVEPHFANQSVYIGGMNRYGNQTFYLPDGSHVTVGSWAGLHDTTPHCLSMDGTSGFGTKVVDCLQNRKFICTMDS